MPNRSGEWYIRFYLHTKRHKYLHALCKGNIAALGEALTCYWSQKKHIAPGCEPRDVKIFMDHMDPFVYGQSLAGAGGIHISICLVSVTS